MKFVKQFENKKVLVLGLAKSGESAARLLDRLGAIVTVNDGKPFEENPAAQSLLEEGIKVVTGGHPLNCWMKTLQSWSKIQESLIRIQWLKKRLKKAFRPH